ncbi:hypothetical protein D3C78_1405980 [compost metagenome]
MRSNTLRYTSFGRSMALTRTSTTSMPNSFCAMPLSDLVMAAISASRSPETTSCRERVPNWLDSAETRRCDRRSSAICFMPEVAV